MYDISVLYHPSKINVVVDALSRLSMGRVAHVENDNGSWFVMFIELPNRVFGWLIPPNMVLWFIMVLNRLLCRM